MSFTAEELLEAIGSGEAQDWEFKSAAGGLPGSLWETYSAMANTEGGLIVLGVSEQKDGWVATGVGDANRVQSDLWNLLNNPQKVSLNLLSDRDVSVHEVGGATLIALRVPRADRRQRPIYLNNNPLTGSYRRNFEGDYRCRPEEVERMLGDRGEAPFDARVLESFGWDDFDEESIRQYRNLFRSRDPEHAWHAKDDRELLTLLGAWHRDRRTGAEGPTVAGLLMFGRDETIRDSEAVPGYWVDYREKLSEGAEPRWDHRIFLDGKWAGNLLQFYRRTIQRLTGDLPVPFRLEGLTRIDDTPVHEALREALTNALIHADYRGAGGIVVWRRRDGFEFSNPGTLLISLQQLKRGGISECRNRNLQKLFQFMGRGERAGSGIETMLRGWQSGHWTVPDFEETANPDRVVVRMPTVSLIPRGVPERLESLLGSRIGSLPALERQALVTAAVEGRVSNSRLQLLASEHPATITKALTGLAGRNLLIQKGQKRWAHYVLPEGAEPSLWGGPADRQKVGSGSPDSGGRSPDKVPNPPDGGPSFPDSAPSFPDSGPSFPDNGPSFPDDTTEDAPLDEAQIQALRAQVFLRGFKGRLKVEALNEAIVALCTRRVLTAAQLAQVLGRNPAYLQERALNRLVSQGRLAMRFPGNPTHPQQAYWAARKDGTA